MKRIILSVSLAVLMTLLLSASAFAHGPFAVMDSAADAGQEVSVEVIWGHFPVADGILIRSEVNLTGTYDVNWNLYVIHPNGTVENLDSEVVVDGSNEWLKAAFVPITGGYYQVVFERERMQNIADPEGRMQVFASMSAFVHVDGEGVQEPFNGTPGDRPLQIIPSQNIAHLTQGSIFEGQVLYSGVPFADAALVLEDENEALKTFRTDADGRFSIPFPKTGTFVLLARHINDDVAGTVANDQEIVRIRADHFLMITVK